MLRVGVQAPDLSRVEAMLAHLPGALEKAVPRAINRAVNSAKAEAVRRVKARYTITDTELRKGIKVIPATKGRFSAMLIATSKLHAASKFKLSKSGTGPVTQIIKGNSRPWPAAFIAKMKSGHIGLFARETAFSVPSRGKYARKKTRAATRGTDRGQVGSWLRRQKLIDIRSVSSAEMVGHLEVLEETMRIAQEILVKELDRQVGLFASGKVR